MGDWLQKGKEEKGENLTPFFSPNINEVCIWCTWRVCIQVELVTGGLSPVCASCSATSLSSIPLPMLKFCSNHLLGKSFSLFSGNDNPPSPEAVYRNKCKDEDRRVLRKNTTSSKEG